MTATIQGLLKLVYSRNLNTHETYIHFDIPAATHMFLAILCFRSISKSLYPTAVEIKLDTVDEVTRRLSRRKHESRIRTSKGAQKN